MPKRRQKYHKSQRMWMTPRKLFSSHNVVHDHANSQTVTVCTGPAQVQARQNPSPKNTQ